MKDWLKKLLDKFFCALLFIIGAVIIFLTWSYYPSTAPFDWIAENTIFSAVFRLLFFILTMFGFALVFGASLCFDDKKNRRDKNARHNDGEFDSFD